MSTLIYLACTLCLAIASRLWLTGYWLALDVPRVKIVSEFVPIVLVQAVILLFLLPKIGVRRGVHASAKLICAFGAVAFLLLASPLVTAESRYFEAIEGTVLLGLMIAVSGTLLVTLFRNVDGLSERRLLVALVVVSASCYFWFGLWTYDQHPPDGDEPYYLLTAHSLAYDHDLDRTNNFKNKDYLAYYPYTLQPQFRSVKIKGKEYEVQNYNVGFPILITLPYRIFGFRGAVALINLLAALLVANVFLLSQELGAERKDALLGALIFGFSVPMLNYANQIFPATACALLAIYAFRRLSRIGPGRRREMLILLALCVALFMLKIRLSLLIAPILLIAMWRTARRKTMWLYASGGLGVLIVLGYVLRDRIVTLRLLTSRLDELLRMGIGDLAPSSGILGQMLDQQFGLLVLAPVYVLAIAGAVSLYKINRGVLGRILLVIGPYYLVVGSMPWWNASWCPPCRFLIVILPFLGALLGLGLGRIATFRQAAGLSLAATASAIVAFLHLLSPVFRYDQANGANRALCLLHMNTYIDLSRFLPSFFRTDIMTPVKVILEILAFAVLFVVIARIGKRRAEGVGVFRDGRYLDAAAVGMAAVAFILAAGTVADLTTPKCTYEMEDEPLSIYDPPSRAFIRGGRRITPGYPLERDVQLSPGEKLVIVEAMMRNPIWTTVPNLWLRLEGDNETVRAIDEPVDVELMEKYYNRVKVAGGHYRMRLGIAISGVDMRKINPDKVANIYVDRVQIFDANGLEAFLYANFGRLYNLFSLPKALDLMGQAYFIQPRYKKLGEAVFRSFMKAERWPEAADFYSFRADSDPFDLRAYTPESLMMLAEAELDRRRFAHALQVLKPVLGALTVPPRARLLAAKAHMGLNQIEQALSILPSDAADPAFSAEADYLRSVCLMREGETREAFDLLTGVAGHSFEQRFEALCQMLLLARTFHDDAQADRAIRLMRATRTTGLTPDEMTRSGGRPADGGWMLDRNGFFEAPVNVLSDTLAIKMNVKAEGTFETHVETGLVIDPATGLARYVFPNLKITLGDLPPKFIRVPFLKWTNTYVFFNGLEPGTYNLRIAYINDHTFQKDKQDRKFFLRHIWLQSAIMFFRDELKWRIDKKGGVAVFETDIAPRFPVRTFAVNISNFPAGQEAHLRLDIAGERRAALRLHEKTSSLVERTVALSPGKYHVSLTLRSVGATSEIEQIAASIELIGFSY